MAAAEVSEAHPLARVMKRARPWLIALGAIQVGLRIGCRLAAYRLDSGDAGSNRLRRVCTLGEVSLKPTSETLSSLRFDLMLAGADLDLTEARPAPGGADVTFTCILAGGNVRVPPDWTVAADSVGVGGVSFKHSPGSADPFITGTADLRIHLRALLGGVTVTD